MLDKRITRTACAGKSSGCDLTEDAFDATPSLPQVQ